MTYLQNEKQIGDYKIEIFDDEWLYNPREDHEQLGTAWTSMNRYSSLDKMPEKDVFKSLAKEFNMQEPDWDIEEHIKFIERIKKYAVILPIYKYEHGNTIYSTKPFSCKWDSGQVGFIFVRKEKIREWYSIKKITKKWIETIEGYLESELKEYTSYCNGTDLYRFVIADKNGDEMESVGGYHCYDGTEDIMNEAISYVNHYIKRDRKEKIEKVKTLIKNKVPLLVRQQIVLGC